MDLQTKIFDQVAAARTGQKTVSAATEEICGLLVDKNHKQALSDFLDYCDRAGWIKHLHKHRVIEDYIKHTKQA